MVSTRRSARLSGATEGPDAAEQSTPLKTKQPDAEPPETGTATKRRTSSRVVTASPAPVPTRRSSRQALLEQELQAQQEAEDQPSTSQPPAAKPVAGRLGLPPRAVLSGRAADDGGVSQSQPEAQTDQTEPISSSQPPQTQEQPHKTAETPPAELPVVPKAAAPETTAVPGKIKAKTPAKPARTQPSKTVAAEQAPSPAPKPAPAPKSSQPADDLWDFSTDDDEDEDGDEAGGMMSKLAASIRAALHAKAGKKSGTHSKPSRPAPEPVIKGAAGDKSDLEALHWIPEVQVKLPTKEPTRAVLQLTVEAEKEKDLSKKLLVPPRDPAHLSKAHKAAKPDTAGKGWFDLPAQKIDDDMKRELRLLRLRGAYDSKRFYKTFDNTKFPKHFAMGTVVEGAADFYGGRLEAKQRRKRTLTDQLLADGDLHQTRKKRYAKLQAEATKYQKVKKRKTEQPRNAKPKHRPQH